MSNIYAVLLAAVPALLNIGILVYLLFFLPRGKTTRIFALFITALFLWQIRDVLARTIADEQVMRFWDSVLCIGWLGIGPLIFHFVWRFTSSGSDPRPGILIAVYTVFLGFYTTYMSFGQPLEFVHKDFWGWMTNPRPDSFDMVQRHAISILVIASIIKLGLYVKKQAAGSIKRKQGVLIAVGMFIPAVQGTLTQVIFPTYFGFELPVTSTFMTFLSVAIIIALARYRLFNVDDSLNVEGVLKNLRNVVLVLSPSGKVVYMNSFARKTLGSTSAHAALSEHDIFADADVQKRFEKEVFLPAVSGKACSISDYETSLRRGNAEVMHVLLSSEAIWNNGKLQGVLLIANDITHSKNYQAAIEEQNARLREISWTQSHVVRAPLARIMGLADLIKNHRLSNTEVEESLDFLLESAHELDKVVRDIINESQKATKEVR